MTAASSGDGVSENGAAASSISNNQTSSLLSVGGEPTSTIVIATSGAEVESSGGSVLTEAIISASGHVPPNGNGNSRPDIAVAEAESRTLGDNSTTSAHLQQDTILEKPALFTDNDSKVSSLQEKIELTVIDGPLAVASVTGGKQSTDKPCAVVGGIVAYHTPTSSLGSSLGEIMGESSSVAVHDNDSPTVDGSTSNKSMLDHVSTEQPNTTQGQQQQKQQLSVEGSDATPDNMNTSSDEFTATSTTPLRGKPTLKHSIPSALDSASSTTNATSSAPPPSRSLQPPKTSRIHPSSSHDNLNNTDNDPIENRDSDIHDDDENDIPAHIKSKIVEKSPAERYIRFNEKLGSGAYKDVYRAYDTIEGIEVAWNVVKLSGVPKAERVRIVNEVRLLERLHHPNIISFHGSWVNRETERVIFVTEILSSGTLKSFVQKVQLIRWKIFKRWAIQILNGLEYLHSQNPPIIHRDLKCDNIFINGTSGDLRIGDFGLSTAINQKNQPLSVLGTPEFMAPELYDENYNEKVDIYAFGMLLLEIVTREVPYHECANPAQIYKKVTQGIPPSSLRRVKSNDARNFILLCLGIGEDANARPSATDLLKHSFLEKNSDDELTVEVEPAVEDMVIEEGRSSMTFSDTGSDFTGSNGGSKFDQMKNEYASSILGHDIPSQVAKSVSPGEHQGKPPRSEHAAGPTHKRTPSHDLKISSEHLGKPPAGPTHKRNTSKDQELKVLSQAIATSNDTQTDDQFGEMPENEANMKKVTVLMGRGTALDDSDPPAKEMEDISLSSTPPLAPLPAATLPKVPREAETANLARPVLYKVSAVPPEVIDGGKKPYPNNVINLALTLPDASQTTIEFNFDLVNDDPVQVAREMITELDEVPDDAILEISEAISGVARHARMKQNQWTELQQQQQQNVLAQQALHLQHQQHSQSMMALHTPGSALPPQGMEALQNIVMPTPQQLMYGSGFTPAASYQNDPSQSVVGGSVSNVVQSQPQPTHLGQLPPPLPPASTQMFAQANISTSQTQQAMHSRHQSVPVSPVHVPQSTQIPPPITMARSTSMEPSSHAKDLNAGIAGAQLPHPSVVTQPHPLPPIMSSLSQDTIATTQSLHSAVAATQDSSKLVHPSQYDALQGGVSSLASLPTNYSTESANGNLVEIDTEEIRLLELEFEKKLQRAKKSYDTRMDNLHRSKEEAEAQHQMTLEKHEKERIEFEKRMRLAEEEQAKRLSQIQKEFMERKREVQQQLAMQPLASPTASSQLVQNMTDNISSRPPLHGAHQRSSSHFDPSLMNPILIASDHKRNSSDSDLPEPSRQADSQPLQPRQSPP